ncbi:MAG: hypothetical protein ACAI25_03895 [Planctomycetota bacterium]
MPSTRTLTALGAAATSLPLALGAASLLGTPTPASSALRTAAIARPAPSLVAAATTSRPSLAAAALVRPQPLAASRLSSSALRLSSKIFLTPEQRLHDDAATRGRAYLEHCATDELAGGKAPRVLSDVIAVLECGSRARTADRFGAVPWGEVDLRVAEGIAHLDGRDDGHPPDFDANDLLRILYRYPAAPYVFATPTVSGAPAPAVAPTPATSAVFGMAKNPANRLTRDRDGRIREALKRFKFWCDEPGPDKICWWSENHQILFATAEYLAGQLMPNEWFTNGGMRGTDHKNKARVRLLRWLDERLKFGFSEWNSPGYYEEDLKALYNLVDFCDDPRIVKRAAMVLDTLVFDLARLTHKGSFGVTAARCYEKLGGDGSKWKSNGWAQPVGNLIEVLFGTRGRFNGTGSVGALFHATSSYDVPTVLLSIGKDTPDHFVDRSRVSIDPSEARDHGIGFSGLEDGMFWWSKGCYFNKEMIVNSRWMMRTFGLQNMRDNVNGELSDLSSIFWGASDGQLRAVADSLSPFTEGMNLTKANLYTYKNKDVMLSSVQDYRRGQIGPQQQIWQATVDMDASVYTTLPGKSESDGPGYWTGNASMPSVIQHENVAIIAYDAPMITKLKFGLHRTHAWFPADKFEGGLERRRGSNLHGAWGVTSDGTWLFGKRGDAYVGLYSNEGYTGGPTDWVAAGSWTNVFICQVGNKKEFGSFDNFKNQLTAARIYIHYPRVGDWSPVYCGYDIPGKGRLELHWGGQPVLNGRAFDVHNFDRYENNYTNVPWMLGAMGVRHNGYKLIHLRDTVNPMDPRTDTRIPRATGP